MAVEIQHWLNSHRNYQEGVALYNKYGHSEALKRMFTWQYTAYNERKLSEALEGLFEEKGEQLAEPESDSIFVEAHWKQKYKQASYLHSQLRHLATPVERRIAAHQILNLMDEVQAIWDQKQEPAPTTPAVPNPDPTDSADSAGGSASRRHLQTHFAGAIQVFKQIKRLGVQISKHKKNPERAAEVEQWIAQKSALEQTLNG